MVKTILLFIIVLGIVTMYFGKLKVSNTAPEDKCSIQRAMRSVRLGKWVLFTLILNIFLIGSILIFNL